jgi:hypothetical protein
VFRKARFTGRAWNAFRTAFALRPAFKALALVRIAVFATRLRDELTRAPR